MAGSSFMSGLVNGFMAFGGGGAMGGAGGAAGSAGAGDAASGASGASSGSGSSSMPGMPGGGGGDKPNATPIPSGGENVGKTSSALSTDSSSGGGGDIVRTNPYGDGSTTPANASGPSADQQKLGKNLMDTGNKMGQTLGANTTSNFGQGNTYGALFGSNGSAFQTGAMGAGQMGMSSISPPPMTQIAAPNVPMAQVTAPTQLPAPMPLNMNTPQAVPIAPVPVAPLGSTISDRNAKTNIHQANGEMDRFLQRVYDGVVAKRNK